MNDFPLIKRLGLKLFKFEATGKMTDGTVQIKTGEPCVDASDLERLLSEMLGPEVSGYMDDEGDWHWGDFESEPPDTHVANLFGVRPIQPERVDSERIEDLREALIEILANVTMPDKYVKCAKAALGEE